MSATTLLAPTPVAAAAPRCASRRTLGDVLGRLGASPVALLGVMVVLNALVHPYQGFDHDARLYAAQVRQRVQPGLLDDDLFFKYGSQDRFTLFGPSAAPLVAVLGLAPAFFVLFLASKILLFASALKLMQALIADRAALALGGLLVAVSALPFGGNDIFQINEPFLTPRTAAAALVMLQMEKLLAGRLIAAIVLTVGAFLLHPLMAVAGVFLFVAAPLTQRPRVLVAVSVLGVAAAVGTLAWEPLGRKLFGHMDDHWRDIHLRTCFFVRPALWTLADWLRLGFALVVVGVAAATFARGAARLLLAVAGVGLLGLVGTVIAVQSHYLLLIQVSCYRTLWPLQFLAVPLGVAWTVRLHRRGEKGWAALVAVLVFSSVDADIPFAGRGLAGYALIFAMLVVWFRGLGTQPARMDWLNRAAVGAFVVGAILLTLWDLAVVVQLAAASPGAPDDLEVHPILLVRNANLLLFKLPLAALAMGMLWIVTPTAPGLRFGVAAALVGIAYHGLVTAVAAAPGYAISYDRAARRAAFVGDFLDSRAGTAGRSVTVYWPTDLRYIWFDLGSRSYFNTMQMSGNAFQRDTAIEGWRRRDLVRCFEADKLRRCPPSDPGWRDAFNEFFEIGPDEPAPTRADLLRLAADPILDVIVIQQEFSGLWSATDGKYYIYDCERLRRTAHDE